MKALTFLKYKFQTNNRERLEETLFKLDLEEICILFEEYKAMRDLDEARDSLNRLKNQTPEKEI
jgi:hypothetical protein